MWLILSDIVQRLTKYLCFRYSNLELFQEESPIKYCVQYVDPISTQVWWQTFWPSMVIQPSLFLSVHNPRELKNPLRFFPGEIWATPALMHCGEEHRVWAQRGVLCSGRELCRGLIVLHWTGTNDERKGSDVINLPFLTPTGFQKVNAIKHSNVSPITLPIMFTNSLA